MSAEDPSRLRARQIRLFLIQAGIWLGAAPTFAIVGRATGLNGTAGVAISVSMFVFSVGAILWLKRQQRREDR
jgi:hypothetical protein